MVRALRRTAVGRVLGAPRRMDRVGPALAPIPEGASVSLPYSEPAQRTDVGRVTRDAQPRCGGHEPGEGDRPRRSRAPRPLEPARSEGAPVHRCLAGSLPRTAVLLRPADDQGWRRGVRRPSGRRRLRRDRLAPVVVEPFVTFDRGEDDCAARWRRELEDQGRTAAIAYVIFDTRG